MRPQLLLVAVVGAVVAIIAVVWLSAEKPLPPVARGSALPTRVEPPQLGPSGLTLRGVLKSADGTALAEAEVTAYAIALPPADGCTVERLFQAQCGDPFARLDAHELDDSVAGRARTDAEGAFAMSLQAGVAHLYADASGRLVALQRNASLVSGPVELVARPPSPLRGQVVDEAGHGVADAEVTLVLLEPLRSLSLRSDAEGRFDWPVLPENRYGLLARSQGRAAIATGTTAKEITLTLSRMPPGGR